MKKPEFNFLTVSAGILTDGSFDVNLNDMLNPWTVNKALDLNDLFEGFIESSDDLSTMKSRFIFLDDHKKDKSKRQLFFEDYEELLIYRDPIEYSLNIVPEDEISANNFEHVIVVSWDQSKPKKLNMKFEFEKPKKISQSRNPDQLNLTVKKVNMLIPDEEKKRF